MYTCSQSLKTKLSKLASGSPDIKLERQDKYSVTYSVPKSWIKIQKPAKLNLTEEEIRKRIEQMKTGKQKQLQK